MLLSGGPALRALDPRGWRGRTSPHDRRELPPELSPLKQASCLKTTRSHVTPGNPTSVMGALGFTFLAAAISCSWFTSSVMDSRSSGLTFSVAPAAEAARAQGPVSPLAQTHRGPVSLTTLT